MTVDAETQKKSSKAPPAKAPPPLSLRAYAKRRGVSAEAVSKAVSVGRLKSSVVLVDGAPKIADPDLADREWSSNTRPRVDQPPAAARAAEPSDAEPYDPSADTTPDSTVPGRSRTIS